MTRVQLHSAPRLCDGRSWHDGGWVRVDQGHVVAWGVGEPPGDVESATRHGCLLPGLVDAHVRIKDYPNRVITADALSAHRGCVELAVEAGVGAVLDVGGHSEIPPTLAEIAEPHWPVLRWTGPVLDGPPASAPATRLLTSPGSARHAVAVESAGGATWVHTGPSLTPELVDVVVRTADEHGMSVLHQPGRTDAAVAARLGVRAIQDLPLCGVPWQEGLTPADAVRAWAGPATAHRARHTLDVLAAHDVALLPLLHSWRRASVLEEAVGEPRLERLLPIAPFHQYLLDMRGPGMAFGRRYARAHFNYEHLKGRVRAEFDGGWSALLTCLADAHRSGPRLVSGSNALGVSLVPGFALHDELEWWEHAGLSRDEVLLGATGASARLLGVAADNPWQNGVLGLRHDPAGAPGFAAAMRSARFVALPGDTRIPLRHHPQEVKA